MSLAGLAHSKGAQFFGLAHELAHVQLCHMTWAAAEWKKLEGKPLTVFPVHITRRLHQFEYDADLLAFRWLNLLGRDAFGDALDAMRPLVEQRRSRASETHPFCSNAAGGLARGCCYFKDGQAGEQVLQAPWESSSFATRPTPSRKLLQS